ncbi:GNAT family N-acetyltransferase [Croceibacterium selenioxidans]|uniref:GNAT family N-acetyltransferase n=1 Tax=Croceibacterium selenioxidans TaxID=2838833 RepID=UPI0030843283
MSALLRPATGDDAEALAKLGRESFIAAFGHLYRPEDLESFLQEYRTPEAFRAHLADPPTLIQVAEIDGRLAAYSLIVRGHLMGGRPDPQPGKPVYLSQLYCAGDMTGHGLGAALIEWAIAAARDWGADALQLSVFSENFGAQRFYQRYGFAKVADIDFWVGNQRDDEFLYELQL